MRMERLHRKENRGLQTEILHLEPSNTPWLILVLMVEIWFKEILSKPNFNNNACESLSTQSIDLTSIKIYPNPASTNVTVQTNQFIDKLELYNVLGKKIRVKSATNSFDLSDLASGIYILKIYAGIETYSRKIVKQ